MSRLILHVDDDPRLPDGVAAVLASEDFRLLRMTDPERVIRVVEREEPSLVLMDVDLSGCDGLDLLAGIAAARSGRVPVLVVTRHARESAMHGEVIALGVTAFMTRPVRGGALLEAIRETARPVPTSPLGTSGPDPAKTAPSGSLAERPVPELLAQLRRRAASGVLHLSRNETAIELELRNGTPVRVASSSADDAGGPGHPDGRSRSGAMSGASVASPEAGSAEDLLFSTFGWTDGTWQLLARGRIESGGAREIGRDPGSLLLTGVLEACSRARVRQRLKQRAMLYVSVCDDGGGDSFREVELSRRQSALLSRLGGQECLGDLLASMEFDERLLYALWVSGRIELHTVPTFDLTEPPIDAAEALVSARSGEPSRSEASVPRRSTRVRRSRPGTEGATGATSGMRAKTGVSAGKAATAASKPAASPMSRAESGTAARRKARVPMRSSRSRPPTSVPTSPGTPPPTARRASGPDATPIAPSPEPASPTSAAPVPPTATPLPTATSDPPTPRAPLGKDDLSDILRELTERMAASDDFGVLGVEVDASDDELQAAYHRRLHDVPEEAFDATDMGLRVKAQRIQDRIEAAYAHLKDPESRRAYTLLRQEETEDREAGRAAERALEGERWFRKGKRLLESERHAPASEAFGMAAHLDPSQGEYLAHLGYALFLSNPGNRIVQREAIEHVANGIKRSPQREMSHVFLGRILQARGDDEAARKLFRRALRLAPECEAARRALRGGGGGGKDGSGILSKLLRR